MKITSPHKSRERILAYGGFAAGKTYNWFSIAKAVNANFFVIDTDQTVIPYLESEEFAEVEERIDFREPLEWPEYIEALKDFRKKATPNDWLVVDMASEPWNEVQNYYAEQVYGKDLGDYWLEYRKQIEANDGRGSKSAFDGTTDWQAIKKMYRQYMAYVIRFPGHVYLATGEKKINDHLDGPDVTKLASNGWKPEGEKTLGHAVRTVLRLNNQRATTVKDRQREVLSGVKIGDFSKDYLLKVAGWLPEVGGKVA